MLKVPVKLLIPTPTQGPGDAETRRLTGETSAVERRRAAIIGAVTTTRNAQNARLSSDNTAVQGHQAAVFGASTMTRDAQIARLSSDNLAVQGHQAPSFGASSMTRNAQNERLISDNTAVQGPQATSLAVSTTAVGANNRQVGVADAAEHAAEHAALQTSDESDTIVVGAQGGTLTDEQRIQNMLPTRPSQTATRLESLHARNNKRRDKDQRAIVKYGDLVESGLKLLLCKGYGNRRFEVMQLLQMLFANLLDGNRYLTIPTQDKIRHALNEYRLRPVCPIASLQLQNGAFKKPRPAG